MHKDLVKNVPLVSEMERRTVGMRQAILQLSIGMFNLESNPWSWWVGGCSLTGRMAFQIKSNIQFVPIINVFFSVKLKLLLQLLKGQVFKVITTWP